MKPNANIGPSWRRGADGNLTSVVSISTAHLTQLSHIFHPLLQVLQTLVPLVLLAARDQTKCNAHYANIKPTANHVHPSPPLNSYLWSVSSARSSTSLLPSGPSSPPLSTSQRPRSRYGFRTGGLRLNVFRRLNWRNWRWQQNPSSRPGLASHSRPHITHLVTSIGTLQCQGCFSLYSSHLIRTYMVPLRWRLTMDHHLVLCILTQLQGQYNQEKQQDWKDVLPKCGPKSVTVRPWINIETFKPLMQPWYSTRNTKYPEQNIAIPNWGKSWLDGGAYPRWLNGVLQWI